jgi:hypothetical protein
MAKERKCACALSIQLSHAKRFQSVLSEAARKLLEWFQVEARRGVKQGADGEVSISVYQRQSAVQFFAPSAPFCGQ